MTTYPSVTSFFARHLVSIGFTTNADGPSGVRLTDGRRVIVSSGSTYVHNGHLFLITAGHIVTQMKALLAAGHTIECCQLYDNYHQTGMSRQPVPFAFRSEDAISLDTDEGLDLAILRLPKNTQALLLANDVVPLDPASCRNCPDDITDYFMLGLPAQSAELHESSGSIHVRTKPTLIPLKHEPNPPAECMRVMPLWYGFVPPEAGDIQGMSGGLILGARLVGETHKYWPVAIQSGWYEARRLAYAVPSIAIPILLDKLAEAFRQPFDLEASKT